MFGATGWSFICRNMVPVIKSGKILIGKPAISIMVSGADKSAAQRNSDPRNSTALRSMVKKPKNTGIWMTIGKQPPI